MPTFTVRAEHADRKPQVGQVAYYRRLPESALLDRRLTRTALALLGILDGYARDKPHCWPSVATLMAHLGRSRRCVQEALRLLKATGHLEERPAENPTGRVLVLAWKTPAPPRAQMPYSQGIPRERRRFAPEGRGNQGKEGKGFAPLFGGQEPATCHVVPRVPDRPATLEEKSATRRQWLEAVPVGSPLARLVADRLGLT